MRRDTWFDCHINSAACYYYFSIISLTSLSVEKRGMTHYTGSSVVARYYRYSSRLTDHRPAGSLHCTDRYIVQQLYVHVQPLYSTVYAFTSV